MDAFASTTPLPVDYRAARGRGRLPGRRPGFVRARVDGDVRRQVVVDVDSPTDVEGHRDRRLARRRGARERSRSTTRSERRCTTTTAPPRCRSQLPADTPVGADRARAHGRGDRHVDRRADHDVRPSRQRRRSASRASSSRRRARRSQYTVIVLAEGAVRPPATVTIYDGSRRRSPPRRSPQPTGASSRSSCRRLSTGLAPAVATSVRRASARSDRGAASRRIAVPTVPRDSAASVHRR